MCGIAGKLVAGRTDGVDRDVLERMCAALEHRGPDSRGVFVDGRVGLGIQRLRVVDLVTGDQPIYNEDRSVVVVLNGEIYNFQELRSQLIRRGHRFATAGDTEVIVHLYEEKGAALVKELEGMFAFALWDRREQRLLLARDRVGKKPLYYALRDGGISFASELRALIEDHTIPREIDAAACDAFLAYGYVPAPRSIFTAVRKLPPAHTLVLDGRGTRLERYWRLSYQSKHDVTDRRELQEQIRHELLAATRKRLIADVPVGAFLSGGIDSSAVVAAMAQIGGERVRTFSIGFDHAKFDELQYARRVSKLFDTEHHEFVVRADAAEAIPRIVRQYGEPFADASAIPCFYLSQMTRDHVTVALNGDGGDENFAGYTRYVANRLASRFDTLPLRLRQLAAASAPRPRVGDVSSVRNKARRLLETLAADPAARYSRYVSWIPDAERAQLYTGDFAATSERADAGEIIAQPWREASGDDLVDVMLEVDASTYLPGDLIPKIDIATMAYGLEARSPFLDHGLMQFAASIPASLKVRGSQKKWILREALREWLPSDILDRPKQGFSPPIGNWLRGELKQSVREVLLDSAAIDRGYFRPGAIRSLLDRQAAGVDEATKPLWALFMLELWHREFVDRASSTLPLPVAA